jgi:hypothetical protein
MGELAQLSGRPSQVDGVAREPVETPVIPPSRLHDLLVEEAELGERSMRALILRRMRLLRSGAGGPIIVGGADNADVLRLENFLDRNSHPHQRLDPNSDLCARALIERFHITSRELPIVLCPNGAILRNPADVELARCIGMLTSLDRDRVYEVAIVGAGPAGLAAAVYAASEGLSPLSWTVARLVDRPAPRRASKTSSAGSLNNSTIVGMLSRSVPGVSQSAHKRMISKRCMLRWNWLKACAAKERGICADTLGE